MLVAVVLCFVVTELPQGVLTIYRYIARDFLHLIFDTTAVRHLGFSKVRISDGRYGPTGSYALSCQILSKSSVEPLRRCQGFTVFKMAAVRHLG